MGDGKGCPLCIQAVHSPLCNVIFTVSPMQGWVPLLFLLSLDLAFISPWPMGRKANASRWGTSRLPGEKCQPACSEVGGHVELPQLTLSLPDQPVSRTPGMWVIPLQAIQPLWPQPRWADPWGQPTESWEVPMFILLSHRLWGWIFMQQNLTDTLTFSTSHSKKS